MIFVDTNLPLQDRNGDEQLTVSDLKYGLYEFGLELPDHDIKVLFLNSIKGISKVYQKKKQTAFLHIAYLT